MIISGSILDVLVSNIALNPLPVILQQLYVCLQIILHFFCSEDTFRESSRNPDYSDLQSSLSQVIRT